MQPPAAGPQSAGDVLRELAAGPPPDVLFAGQTDGLGGRIRAWIGPIEEAHEIEAGDRLGLATARRIAAGLCGSGTDDPEELEEELEGIFESMRRKERFTRSPAAYLVKCAKRRGWIARKGNG